MVKNVVGMSFKQSIFVGTAAGTYLSVISLSLSLMSLCTLVMKC